MLSARDGSSDYDIWPPPPMPSAPATPVSGGPLPMNSKLPVGTRKVKVSQISDQLDDIWGEMPWMRHSRHNVPKWGQSQ